MEDLIKALQIFASKGNVLYPTHCEHDTLYIVGHDENEFSLEEMKELYKLGFEYDESEECFYSFRYGSA